MLIRRCSHELRAGRISSGPLLVVAPPCGTVGLLRIHYPWQGQRVSCRIGGILVAGPSTCEGGPARTVLNRPGFPGGSNS
jgi:hypothetical protein